ncbi:MAG: MarR family transcriptional regulator [Selenomonas sp.]|nr:MarR family transcriptional regulator [Selenomonas sp.]
MLQETTGYIICRTARKIHQFMTKALADYDITPEQWVVLQIVSKEKNLSQQDLSARLEKDKNSTKALVDRLIKKELLTRQKDDNDKRFYKLQATAAGVQLTKKLADDRRLAMGRPAGTGFLCHRISPFARESHRRNSHALFI